MTKLLVSLLIFISISTYANETVPLIVASSTGGLMYRYSLELQPFLSKILNLPVVIESKPGAQGLLAAQYLATKTNKVSLLLGSPHSWESLDSKHKNFSSVDDIMPIAYLGSVPSVIFSNSSSSFYSYSSVIEYSKYKDVSYGISGTSVFVPLMKKYSLGTNLIEVLYHGGAPVVTAVLGGHLDIGISTPDAISSQVSLNKLIPLAVVSNKRSNIFTNTPTLKELGFITSREYRYYNNIFLWANNSANPIVIDNIQKEVKAYLLDKSSEVMRKKLDIQLDHINVSPKLYLQDILSP